MSLILSPSELRLCSSSTSVFIPSVSMNLHSHCMCLSVSTPKHTYAHVCTHSCTHAHTHAHTYISNPSYITSCNIWCQKWDFCCVSKPHMQGVRSGNVIYWICTFAHSSNFTGDSRVLQRLLVNTPKDHPDYEQLQKAEKAIHDLALRINSVRESKHEEDLQETLKKLELLLITDVSNLHGNSFMVDI